MRVLSGQPDRGWWSRRLTLALCCGLGVVHVAVGATVASAAAKPVTYTIVIEGTAYAPGTLTVKRGDTVVWVNKDPFPHTVTAKGAFDSHDIAPGKQWKYTPGKLGEFPYTCTLHPNMKGTLAVE
jgi:plastocyanin